MYEAIKIKLEKWGGLTEAFALDAEGGRRGFRIMVGGTTNTSLGIAPALLVAQQANVVDLDWCVALDAGSQWRLAVRRRHDPSAEPESLGRCRLIDFALSVLEPTCAF
jgi:L-alanine-DL-glutamate epimerase-like enolase superfamily enzyme